MTNYLKKHKINTIITSVLLAVVLILSGLVVQKDGNNNYVIAVNQVGATGTADYVGTTLVASQNALNALPAVGGQIVLYASTYTYAGTLTRAINNVTISGMGASTIITRDGVNPVITVGGNNWIIRDCALDAGGVSWGATTGGRLVNVWIGTTYYANTNSTGQITNSLVSGTAPLVVSSNTVVNNLNADLLDGRNSSEFILSPNSPAIGNILSYNGTYWVNVPPGTAGQVLTTNSTATVPYWSTITGGTTSSGIIPSAFIAPYDAPAVQKAIATTNLTGTDDQIAINAVFNSLISTGGYVQFGTGHIVTSDNINVPASASGNITWSIHGIAPTVTVFKCITANKPVFNIGDQTLTHSIEGMTLGDFTAVSANGTGDVILLGYVNRSTFSNIQIPASGRYGVSMPKGGLMNLFVNITVSANLQPIAGSAGDGTAHGAFNAGFYFSSSVSPTFGCNANTLLNCIVEGGQYGYYEDDGLATQGNNLIIGGTYEGCEIYGIYADNCTGIEIKGSSMEANGIDVYFNTVTHSTISGFAASSSAISLQGSCNDVVIGEGYITTVTQGSSVTNTNLKGAMISGAYTNGSFTAFVPYVGIRAYNSSNITVANATRTVLTYSATRWNNNCTLASSSNLTCVVPGYYVITGNILCSVNATGDRELSIYLNGGGISGGTCIAQASTTPTDSNWCTLSVTTIYYLNVGDYVTLNLYQSSGGNLSVIASTTSYSMGNLSPEFSMQRIAP